MDRKTLFWLGVTLLLLSPIGFLLTLTQLPTFDNFKIPMPAEAFEQPVPTATTTPKLPPNTPTPILAITPGTPTPGVTSVPPTTTTPTEISFPKYTVQPGDNLFRLAIHYNTTVSAIVKYNGLSNPNAIYVGQVLVIPYSASFIWPTGIPTVTPGTTGAPPPGTSTATPTATPTTIATLSPSPIAQPSEVIEGEYPNKMLKGQSSGVRVSIKRINVANYTPTLETPGNSSILSTPMIFGTPGNPLEFRFGSKSDVSAIAKLTSPAFEIQTGSAEQQAIDRAEIRWDWSVLAKEARSGQLLDLTIEFVWAPKRGGNPIRRTVYFRRLSVDVGQPMFEVVPLNLTSLALGFIGSGLSIPLLWELIKKLNARQLKAKKTQPKILVPP